MGQARNRGTFEERRAQAIAAGRLNVKRSRSDGLSIIAYIYGLMASIFMHRNVRKRSFLPK